MSSVVLPTNAPVLPTNLSPDFYCVVWGQGVTVVVVVEVGLRRSESAASNAIGRLLVLLRGLSEVFPTVQNNVCMLI